MPDRRFTEVVAQSKHTKKSALRLPQLSHYSQNNPIEVISKNSIVTILSSTRIQEDDLQEKSNTDINII